MRDDDELHEIAAALGQGVRTYYAANPQRIAANLPYKKNIRNLREKDIHIFIDAFHQTLRNYKEGAMFVTFKIEPKHGYAVFEWLAEYVIDEYLLEGILTSGISYTVNLPKDAVNVLAEKFPSPPLVPPLTPSPSVTQPKQVMQVPCLPKSNSAPTEVAANPPVAAAAQAVPKVDLRADMQLQLAVVAQMICLIDDKPDKTFEDRSRLLELRRALISLNEQWQVLRVQEEKALIRQDSQSAPLASASAAAFLPAPKEAANHREQVPVIQSALDCAR